MRGFSFVQFRLWRVRTEIVLGLLSVDGLLHRIRIQCPSTPTYPVYVRTGGAPTPRTEFTRCTAI